MAVKMFVRVWNNQGFGGSPRENLLGMLQQASLFTFLSQLYQRTEKHVKLIKFNTNHCIYCSNLCSCTSN